VIWYLSTQYTKVQQIWDVAMDFWNYFKNCLLRINALHMLKTLIFDPKPNSLSINQLHKPLKMRVLCYINELYMILFCIMFDISFTYLFIQ
jgi:hypothetical protein